MIKLSTSKELEELHNKRTGLEEESRSLKEEQQNLEGRVKVLEEKIAIEELTNSNNATRETISLAESMIDKLERRLQEISKSPETSSTDEIKPEIISTPEPSDDASQGITVAVAEEIEEDNVVTVMPPESPIAPAQEERSENVKKQSEKKKRRIF